MLTPIYSHSRTQAEWEAGEGGRLRKVMAAFSRPTRIVRGKEVPPASVAVAQELFEGEEERALFAAYSEARAKVGREGAAVAGGGAGVRRTKTNENERSTGRGVSCKR